MDKTQVEKLVPEFLIKKAVLKTGAAEEIKQLTFNNVFMHNPTTGTVFFDGTDEEKSWHCDYINGELINLTFDN